MLSAGSFQVLYQNGFLRYISLQEHEILRMIYFAFRDENWATLPLEIRNQKLEAEADRFMISYDGFNRNAENVEVFKWNAVIHGSKDGTITFEISGEALIDIKKNRAGFCILHPVKGSAGQPVQITHPDGKSESGQFPVFVSPDNPFKEIRQMKWQSAGQWYTLDVEGDIFETEDQRNWTDASFKTFCTPQHLRFPVQLRKGEKVRQKITFKPAFVPAAFAVRERTEIVISKTGRYTKLPRIGIGASTESTQLTTNAIDNVRRLQLDHYRIEVTPSRSQWVSHFSENYAQAFELGLPLHVALHLSDKYDEELEAFTQLSLQNRVRIKNISLFSIGKPVTDQRVINEIAPLKKELTQVAFGAGTDFNFTELNKNRFDASALDFVTYAIHPQEHAFDDLSLVENLEGQSETAKTARHIYSKPVHVSPVTLRKRFNPYTANEADRVKTNEEKSDPRQVTEFGLAWTFGSIQALSEGGVESATYYQTVGRQGIMSETGDPFPAYGTFEKLLANRDATVALLDISQPLKIGAMLFEQSGAAALYLVNYTQERQLVRYQEQRIEISAYELKTIKSDIA